MVPEADGELAGGEGGVDKRRRGQSLRKIAFDLDTRKRLPPCAAT